MDPPVSLGTSFVTCVLESNARTSFGLCEGNLSQIQSRLAKFRSRVTHANRSRAVLLDSRIRLIRMISFRQMLRRCVIQSRGIAIFRSRNYLYNHFGKFCHQRRTRKRAVVKVDEKSENLEND